jgi:hypothetical protein
MRAGLRFGTILLAGGLIGLPPMALAQNTTEPATTNTPATDAIGPRELQNFSLRGTRTKPAEEAPAPATTAQQPPARTPDSAVATAPSPRPAAREINDRPAPRQVEVARAGPSPSQSAAPAAAPVQAMPPAPNSSPTTLTTAAAGGPAPATLEPERKVPFLSWLIAAFALGGGVLFFLWQRRPRATLAAGPGFDLFVAPEPTPAPRPQAPRPEAGPAEPTLPPVPAPPKPAPGAPSGVVSSRLRPSIEIGVQPLRCLVDDDQVAIEFEIDLFNAGSAPARAVLAEASLFNPGETQDQQLAAFFANPVGAGNRVDAIPPLKRITMTSQVVAPRGAIQEYDVGGRKSFVPVIAFNALYEWSGGKGQTSAAYLVGRETGHDKLGPLRLDNGAREFRAVGARPLPASLRT